MRCSNKKILCLIIVAVTLLSLAAMCKPIVVHAEKCPMCGNDHKPLAGFKREIFDMYCGVYGSDPFGIVSGQAGGSKSTVADLVLFDTNGAFADIWESIKELYNAMMMIGILLCVISGMIRIITEYTGDTLTPEKIANLLMKMVLGIILIYNGFEIVEVSIKMAGEILKTVATTTQLTTSQYCNYDRLVGADWFADFGEWGSIIFPSMIMSVIRLVAEFICWTRMFDLLARVIFAPIGLHNIFYTGVHGASFGYLRKIFASAAQGAVIIAIFQAFNMIKEVILANSGGTLGGTTMIIILYGSTVLLIIKSQGVTKDIMGGM